MLEFHFADVLILASHLDALDLASSSSLGDAANLVLWAADCATFSQICLSNAVDVIVAFALEAGRRGSGFELDTVASKSIGGCGWDKSVVVLGNGDSCESESEKLHFFTLSYFFYFVSLYLMVSSAFHAGYIQ